MAIAEMTKAPAGARLRITPVFWLSLMVLAVVSLPNLRDPMIRHDDFPALLGHPELYWNKTLHEGRWLNYAWHLRAVITPAWLNFAFYQICWAVFATALAVAVTRRDRSVLSATLMAALILVGPPATLISLWFNTLMPGLGLVAVYGVLVCCASQRIARALLPLFTVLTFMAYTTYPLLLLALCLAATERRSWRDLTGLLLLFSASFVGAVLVTYALNWQVHGVFGVPLADWRDAEPAQGLSGLWANLHWVGTSLGQFVERISLNAPHLRLLQVLCLAGGALVMARRAPLELAYLAAGLITGLGLVALQAAKLGVFVPPRAMIFAWVFGAVIVMRGAQLLSQQARPMAHLGLIAAAFLIVAQGSSAHHRYIAFQTWQGQSRAIGADLAALPGPVHVFGRALESTAGRSASLQSEAALQFRLEQLTGHRILLCDAPQYDCSAVPQPPAATTEWQVMRLGTATVLRVPEVPAPSAD